MPSLVRIHVVTYRRPQLLERSLRSLQAQREQNWVAEVLNDDPVDPAPAALVARLADPRISLSTPACHRGGTGNFNHAFRPVPEPFASILEDDNWWEPGFLETMLGALGRHPRLDVACANERLWQEQPDGNWRDLARSVRPATTAEECRGLDARTLCGGSVLCNSALLWRTARASSWLTPPTIPIDVTEHFRERVIPHPLLLVGQPLVNFAQTAATHRSPDRALWAEYQSLLIGSVFALIPDGQRPTLAASLWQQIRTERPLSGSALLATGCSQRAARPLWTLARPRERLRYAASVVRRPRSALRIWRARRSHPAAWDFLLTGPVADALRNGAVPGSE